MKAEKLREMAEEELLKKKEELRDQLLRLRIQNATAQLDRPAKIRDARKDLARVETLLAERKRAASESV